MKQRCCGIADAGNRKSAICHGSRDNLQGESVFAQFDRGLSDLPKPFFRQAANMLERDSAGPLKETPISVG
ncbi:hypothetical protein [Brevundimonas sp.]|uniref:hypothetical protein n=1 Tax=Brevundimonas sp. TaxID=1871086 RepID=UPI0025FFC0F9|nr:hypothetical protein [Brevundimonas sp.]